MAVLKQGRKGRIKIVCSGWMGESIILSWQIVLWLGAGPDSWDIEGEDVYYLLGIFTSEFWDLLTSSLSRLF